MSSTNESGRQPASARPWWIGLGLIALGAFWTYSGLSLSLTSRYAVIGPGFMVALVGAGLIVLGLLLIRQISQGEVFAPQDSEDAMADAPADWPAFFTAAAAAGLPILIMKPLGFPISAALSFVLIARAFGSRRLVLDAIIGLVLTTVAYFGFTQLGINLGGYFPPLTG